MRSEQRQELSAIRRLFRTLISWRSLAYIAPVALTAVGVLLNVLAFRDAESQVVLEIVGDANVFDVHRPFPDLEIVFRDRNLQEGNQNLRIMTINVVNSGEVDITNADYERGSDWGIKFDGGEVIDVNLVDAKSRHLWMNANPQSVSIDTVIIPKIVFDRGDYITFEVLLLHPINEKPSVSSVGKISGIDEIEVRNRLLSQQDAGFWSQALGGKALTLLVRTIIYFIGSLLAFVVLILSLVGISELAGKIKIWRRKRYILKSQTISNLSEGMVKDFLVTTYSLREAGGLKDLQNALESAEGIIWLPDSDTIYVRHHSLTSNAGIEGVLTDWELRLFIDHAVAKLQNAGFLTKGSKDEVIINPDFSEALRNLLSELEN